MKERSDVEPALSIARHDLSSITNAICSGYFSLFPIPEDEMAVIQIIFIKVNALIGSFSDFPEGNFPEPSNFTKYIGYVLAFGDETIEVVVAQRFKSLD